MSEAESWKQVVVEQDPSQMKPADVANLGPAPREVTEGLERYIRRAKPSWAPLWWTLAALTIAGYTLMFAIDGFNAKLLAGSWWPILLVALAIWTKRNANHRRAALRAVFRDGGLRFARIVENQQIPMGRNRYRYIARFDVDGRKVQLINFNDAMTMLALGTLVEVLYNPAVPDEIVPAFLLV